MEFEVQTKVSEVLSENKNRSPIRLRYAAEVAVFRSKYGGLEDVRARLSLSRRQLCQLLMVDPSAWTRWVTDESKVPPHVYKLLEFYLSDRPSSPNSELQWRKLTNEMREIHTKLEKRHSQVLWILWAAGALIAVLFLILFRK